MGGTRRLERVQRHEGQGFFAGALNEVAARVDA